MWVSTDVGIYLLLRDLTHAKWVLTCQWVPTDVPRCSFTPVCPRSCGHCWGPQLAPPQPESPLCSEPSPPWFPASGNRFLSCLFLGEGAGARESSLAQENRCQKASFQNLQGTEFGETQGPILPKLKPDLAGVSTLGLSTFIGHKQLSRCRHFLSPVRSRKPKVPCLGPQFPHL